jgi:hypothetical protein
MIGTGTNFPSTKNAEMFTHPIPSGRGQRNRGSGQRVWNGERLAAEPLAIGQEMMRSF